MPDFTRFGGVSATRRWARPLGLPDHDDVVRRWSACSPRRHAALAFYGEAIWDPSAARRPFENPILLIVLLVALLLATLTTNVAANVVSPSYDFSNAWPKLISFRTGGVITGVLGILSMPWNLLADSSVYIFTWLGTTAAPPAPIAGVLIADYWWIRRTHLRLADLYRSEGPTGSPAGGT